MHAVSGYPCLRRERRWNCRCAGRRAASGKYYEDRAAGYLVRDRAGRRLRRPSPAVPGRPSRDIGFEGTCGRRPSRVGEARLREYPGARRLDCRACPAHKPRYLMGRGADRRDILEAVRRRHRHVRLRDAHAARLGMRICSRGSGVLNIRNAIHQKDTQSDRAGVCGCL